MQRILLIILIVLAVVIITPFVLGAIFLVMYSKTYPNRNSEVELPTGIWRSAEPNIVLYITPKYVNPARDSYYLGTYDTGHEIIRLFLLWDSRGGDCSLFRENSLNLERGSINGDGTLFYGKLKMVNDELHYTLTKHFQEKTGYNVIVFHRWEDYEPIDPNDWFTRSNE